ncbi:MAG: TetR/AcrR family transcriptional regulator [Burkholderiaceae bacterium]|nr:TetR/AcrR family transcriptional regulator [Burkholderiaceae bacterium]
MAHPLLPKEEVLNRLTTAFRRHGKEGATITVLEGATGLKRNSLYHLFPGGKDEMASAVFEHAAGIMQNHVLSPLRGAGDPKSRLTGMCEALDEFYGSGHESCLIGALSLGDPGEEIRQQIKLGVIAWIDMLAGVIREAGMSAEVAKERARDTVIAIQGALVVSRALGSEEPFKQLMIRLPDALTRKP